MLLRRGHAVCNLAGDALVHGGRRVGDPAQRLQLPIHGGVEVHAMRWACARALFFQLRHLAQC